ncbi:MAG TPA: glycosyltransferase family 4 protein [Tepidisphaeraceae bacterium]|nr:glycosyltransferase family 4 protein [Tepidisphaeraceae bacterium]
MRILHLSTSDTSGGAARAAYRLHTGLRRLGHDSTMLVLKRTSGDPSVNGLRWSTDFATRFRRRRRRKQIARNFEPYKRTLPAGFEIFSDDRSEAGFDLARQLPPCDLINLHWVAGLIDYELFFDNLPKGVPLVWRLADMGALTGGCHYDGGCGKFTAACGACPVLGSNVEHDLSRDVWTRKNAALSNLPDDDLHLVGTTRWIAGEARRSSLLGRFPVTVIPNGLDTDDFAPRDKRFSRDTLGVPRDAKVVLFAAESSNNKRKGFDYVAAALAGMADEPNLFLLSIGGGDPQVANVPHLHLGRITNDRMLSVIYSAADVFAMPSLQESFGQTITESMACGTPVVAFNTGGIPDLVRPGITGQLAAAGDAAALRDSMRQILRNPASWPQLSANCRRIAIEEYSLQTQAQRYAELYQTILSPRPTANREPVATMVEISR